MKTIFIAAESEIDIKPVLKSSLSLVKGAKKVALVSTIQHLKKLNEAKKLIEKETGIKAVVSGQVLGCRIPFIPKDADKIVYIGSGAFHPIGVFLKTKKEVIALDPLLNSAKTITYKDVEELEKRKKAAYIKFLSSKNIGILVSIKPGQANIQGGKKRIEEIKKKYKDKNFYVFLFDTLDKKELENFKFIDFWANAACPRIFEDFEKGIINIEDI